MTNQMNRAIEELCAQRLRELRRSKGLTLHDCEKLSNGEIKAVVLGSYERGTRAVSLARLEQLAELYEVPFQYFFGEKKHEIRSEVDALVFDLRRIRKENLAVVRLAPVKRFLTTIARKRSDWNGEVMSLRQSDSALLELICEMDSQSLHQELRLAGYLFASEVSGQRSL
jgi:transcriptional regulator with XRE-family HTH domain